MARKQRCGIMCMGTTVPGLQLNNSSSPAYIIHGPQTEAQNKANISGILRQLVLLRFIMNHYDTALKHSVHTQILGLRPGQYTAAETLMEY